MKNPKPLALLLTIFTVSLCLLTNVSCKKDDPCAEKTWYKDTDNDNEGDAANTKEACEQPGGYVDNSKDPDDTNGNITSDCQMVTFYRDKDEDNFGDSNNFITQCSGVDSPSGYVEDNTDCDDDDPSSYPGQTYYEDSDMDGFGNPESSQVSCLKPEGYTLDATDCNDNDDTINSEAQDDPNDGIDSDCDGTIETPPTIWNGPDIIFVKNLFDDWTQPEHQDKLTDKVILTRQDKGPLYNYQWWQNTFEEDAVHNNSDNSDLAADFWGWDVSIKDISLINPKGGTKGIRWGIIDPGEGFYQSPAWESFQHYAEPGNGNFFSFNNLVAILGNLDDNVQVNGVLDDFTLEGENLEDAYANDIVGHELWAWLVEENIYVKFYFLAWSVGEFNPGGGVTYSRSSPNNP